MKRYGDLISDGGSNILEQVAAQADRLKKGLADVRHVVAVMSGKGGVGKSSLTVNLASALAMTDHRVGILDADINGACVARMTGVADQRPRLTESEVIPATTRLGVKVMGLDLLMEDQSAPVVWAAPTQKDAFTWRGMMEVAALREFASDTSWGELDILLVDLPPGTDRLPNLVDVLPTFSGAIIVTIPSAVSALVVKRSIRMAIEVLNAPVLGLVENMAARRCPHCGELDPLFPQGHAEGLSSEAGIAFLGSIPFDPRLASAADDGADFLRSWPDSDAANTIRSISARVMEALLSQ